MTQIAGEDVIITPSGALVQASNGAVLKDKLFDLSDNSPLVEGGVIYAHESGKIKAYRLPSSLEKPLEVEQLWEISAPRDQRMTSAALHKGRLYGGTRKGLLEVVDAKTGKLLYRKRLDLGELFSSVSVAGDLVFVSGRNGKTLVLQPGEEYHEVGINETDHFSSNLLFDGPRIYLRTEKYLYCLGD